MRFPRRVWRGFVLCALVLSFLDNAPIHASGQAATSNQGAPTRESKTGQSETRPLEFAEKSFPDAMIGVPFHGSVQAVGGWGFLALTVTGDVPPGLIVETGSNTVAVGGVPSATGEFQLQITAEDVNGNGITQDFTIHVFPLVPGSLATRPVVTDTENFTFTDADSVFFPIVLSDAENFTFTDAETENVLSPVIISDAENFTFSDKETDMNSVFIVDNENFTLTDTDTGMGALQVPDTENITFADTESLQVLTVPTITWPAPAAITYLTALSGAQLDASSTVAGTFVYTPSAGTVLTAGTQTLSVTFTPTDTIHYAPATATVQLTVNQAIPAITWPAPAAITYGTGLSATQLDASSTVPGIFVYSPALGAVLGAGTQTLSATFTPTDTVDYTSPTATVSLTVNQATPAITWPAPGAITYGTALSATQLDASSTVAGAFVYTPTAGTVLSAGTHTLSVTLTPTDTTDYTTATTTVQLTVGQATPPITWPTPAAILYGTALSAIQLDASSTVAGAFVYSPTAGTVLAAGTHTLSVTFTPTDTTDYATALTTVQLTVNPTVAAALLTPAPGSQFGGPSQLFTWSTGTGVTRYDLWLGTAGVGSHNLYYPASTTATQVTVNGLPTDGATIYARLNSLINGVWQSIDYTYTAFGTTAPATLQSPTPGTTLGGSSQTFTWLAGSGVTAYDLWVGTTGVGSHDLYYPAQTTLLQATVNGLPTNGDTVYVRLNSLINGAWQSIDYTYTAFGTTAPATLQSPTPGTTLGGSSQTFTWLAGSAVTAYDLWVGTTGVGSHNLYYPAQTTLLQATVNGLPTNGTTVYVRLNSLISGAWQSIDYTYTAFGTTAPAALLTPAPNPAPPYTQFGGSSQSFTWSAGSGVTQYDLWLGTGGVGSHNLYYPAPTTLQTVTVNGLPTNGATIYARLNSLINGVWQSIDYKYTAFGTTAPATMLTPVPGSQLAPSSQTFTWSAGSGVAAYDLWVGTTGVGSHNLYYPAQTTLLQATVNGLPTNGATVYVRLNSLINGVWQSIDYTYTAALP